MGTICSSDRASVRVPSARAATMTSLGLVPAATAAKQQAGSETWIPNWANSYQLPITVDPTIPSCLRRTRSYFSLTLRLSLS
jgi:hypothetical protein